MSVTIILADNRRLTVKANVNTLLSEVLDKACRSKGLDSSGYTLRRLNKPIDLSVTLRLANIPLNSELHLVKDDTRKDDTVTICMQLEDKARKVGQFNATHTLWQVIDTLFQGDDEIHDDSKVLSVNHLNRQFQGKDVLQSTTLKQMGIYTGRIILRLNSRSADEANQSQKFVENIQFKKPESIGKPAETKPEQDKASKASSPKPMPETFHDPKPSGSSSGFDKMEKKFVQEDILSKFLNQNKKKAGESSKKPAVVCLNANNNRKEDKTAGEAADICDKQDLVLLGDGQDQAVLYSLEDTPKFVDQDVPDSFYEHTPSDIRYILHQLRHQITGSAEHNLETRKIREEKENKKQAKFSQTLLRVILPNDKLVLQAVFKPTDTIGVVRDVLTKYTKHDKLHLFVTPPKTILSPNSTLYELGLVPNASIYASSDDQQPLVKEQFASKLTTFNSATDFSISLMKNIYQQAKN